MIEKQKLDLELAKKYVRALPNQEHTQLLSTADLPKESKYYTFRFGDGDSDANRPMGVPISTFRDDNGVLYISQTTYNHHSITTASSGMGKTQGFILNFGYNAHPQMSYAFADPKGEIITSTRTRLDEIYGPENVLIANFLDPAHSMAFLNPFTDLAYEWLNSEHKKDKKQIRDNILSELKKTIELLYPIESKKDPSWERTARTFILGILCGLLEDLNLTPQQSEKTGRQKTTPDMINFSTMIKVYNSFKWSERGSSFEDGGFISTRKKDSLAYTYMYSVCNNAGNTRANYLGFVDLYLSRYSDPKILEISRYNNLNAKTLSDSPKVLFLVYDITHEGIRDYVNICAAKLISDLLEISHKNAAPLKTPVHFVMDEFATLRPSAVYPNLLATGRGSNLYLHMVVQSLEQLRARYPDEWLTMIDNCDVQIFAGTNSVDTAKHFRESLGTRSVVDSEAFLRGGFCVKQEPVVTLDYLLHRMERGEIFVRINNAQPLHGGFELYYKTPEYKAYPQVNVSKIKSQLPKVDDVQCDYQLPQDPDDDDDDDIDDFFKLPNITIKSSPKKRMSKRGDVRHAGMRDSATRNSANNTVVRPAIKLQKEETIITSVVSEEVLFEEVNGDPHSEWVFETNEAFENKCMDVIEKIVLRDIKQDRREAIDISKKWAKRAITPDRKKVYERVAHEFEISTDQEYELLRNQLFS